MTDVREMMVKIATLHCSSGNGTAGIKIDGLELFYVSGIILADGLVNCHQTDGEEICFPLENLQAVRSTKGTP